MSDRELSDLAFLDPTAPEYLKLKADVRTALDAYFDTMTNRGPVPASGRRKADVRDTLIAHLAKAFQQHASQHPATYRESLGDFIRFILLTQRVPVPTSARLVDRLVPADLRKPR